MFKKLFVSLLFSILLLPGFISAPAILSAATQYVYICNGPASKVYHRAENCRGLSRCSTAIEKVTLAYAEKLGRRPCKIEY